MTYKDYLNNFKRMLVTRYQWSVEEANNFDSDTLKDCFNARLDKYQAYYTIFNKENELQSQ